ncbi:MAG: glycine cleavage system protein H [Lautropia sp.]
MTRIRGHEFPDDLLYAPQTMVWAQPLPDGCVAIGMSALGPATAGEFLVFAARPLGAWIDAGRAIGNVETAKTVSSVRTPIAGRIVAINDAVEANGELIGRAPYEAWLVRLDPRREGGAADPIAECLRAGDLLHGPAAMTAIEAQMALYRVGE